MNKIFRVALAGLLALLLSGSFLAQADADLPSGSDPAGNGAYLIAPSDVVKITVYQVPDLTVEARIEDNGTVSYPLLGTIKLSGLSVAAAEELVSERLKTGGFVTSPSVTVSVLQIRGYLVTVLGHVGKAGRYPLESNKTRLSDMLAIAGGIDKDGSEAVVLSGVRDGKPFRREFLLRDMGAGNDTDDPVLRSGDLVYVPPAPVFYIYGEVQKPGTYRLEPGLTLTQALATGGGLTPKGTRRGMTLHRNTDHGVQIVEPKEDDTIRPNDVIFLREGLL